MNDDIQSGKRAELVSIITAPLGFFALSLLIVEGFLTITLVFSQLDTYSKAVGMYIGAALFAVVVAGVWMLVWFRPTNLTFGEDAHLKHESMMNQFGTEREMLLEVGATQNESGTPT